MQLRLISPQLEEVVLGQVYPARALASCTAGFKLLSCHLLTGT